MAAQATWPDEGNLVNVYLVDQGQTRDAKGGDVWVPDYANLEVPDAALTHTAAQVLWDAPVAGKWQVLIWAPGFSGNGFSEPYSGTITLDRGVVSPTARTATAAPGDTVDGEFTVANAGPTDLAAYASSQVAYNGTALFDDFWYKPFDGTLTPDVDGFYTVGEFWLPRIRPWSPPRPCGRPRRVRSSTSASTTPQARTWPRVWRPPTSATRSSSRIPCPASGR